MDMNVSDFNSLLVTTPVLVQCLDQLELEPEQPSSISPVDADERFIRADDAAATRRWRLHWSFLTIALQSAVDPHDRITAFLSLFGRVSMVELSAFDIESLAK
jgi:hypothetical protein